MKRRKFILTTAFGAGIVLFGRKLFAFFVKSKNMKLTMIYNNISGSKQLDSKWGLSVWIDYGGEAVLFDTGGKANTILNNIRETGLDCSKLKAIVISHNHWDHINALPSVLEKTGYKIPVYVPDEESGLIQKQYPKFDIKGVEDSIDFNSNIWSTGQLKGSFRKGYIYEQSLLISSGGELFVLTGCSHPGIVNIVKKAKEISPDDKVKLVAGGFHLMHHSKDEVKSISDELKELGVQQISPSHCTGDKAIKIFKQEWGDKFIDFNLGDTYDIS